MYDTLFAGDAAGKPNISATACSASIGHISVKFHHGLSWLYDLFKNYAEKKIKNNMIAMVRERIYSCRVLSLHSSEPCLHFWVYIYIYIYSEQYNMCKVECKSKLLPLKYSSAITVRGSQRLTIITQGKHATGHLSTWPFYSHGLSIITATSP